MLLWSARADHLAERQDVELPDIAAERTFDHRVGLLPHAARAHQVVAERRGGGTRIGPVPVRQGDVGVPAELAQRALVEPQQVAVPW